MTISNKTSAITIIVILSALGLLIAFKLLVPTNSNLDTKLSDNINNIEEPTPKISGTPLGILITNPDLKATVTSPLLIQGSATGENFDHNAINFKIIDQDKQVLGQGSSVPGEKQGNGNFLFEVTVEFTKHKPGLGFIMINDNPNYKFPIQFN